MSHKGSPTIRRAGTDYAGYLRIDELLTLQRPLTAAHDEMLFIIVHQSCELWFKLLLVELARADEVLAGPRPEQCLAPLRRIVEIDRLLLHHLDVLDTMAPDGFLEFRDPLAPASGFQSGQFRALERSRDDGSGGGPLWGALCRAVARVGDPMPAGAAPESRAQRIASLASLYRDHETASRAVLHMICELMLDHDELFARWRHHHVLTAAREIGSRDGTGGSAGVAYLRSTIERRLFPELWDTRAVI